MITSTIAKIKNSSIPLPKELIPLWKDAEVFIDAYPDVISIKRMNKSSLSFKDMMNEFRKAAQKTKLSKKTVAQVIKETKKEIYK